MHPTHPSWYPSRMVHDPPPTTHLGPCITLVFILYLVRAESHSEEHEPAARAPSVAAGLRQWLQGADGSTQTHTTRMPAHTRPRARARKYTHHTPHRSNIPSQIEHRVLGSPVSPMPPPLHSRVALPTHLDKSFSATRQFGSASRMVRTSWQRRRKNSDGRVVGWRIHVPRAVQLQRATGIKSM